jgi:hypothetical protein
MANRLCPSCVAENKATPGEKLFLRPKNVRSIYPYACKACWGNDARLAVVEVPSSFGQ